MNDARVVQLFAPSGWAAPAAVQRGAARLRAAGHEVRGEGDVARRWQRFAGTDAARAEEINRWADPAQPLPDIAMAVRGGYGVHRILSRLDYAGLRARLADGALMLVGHSDITALELALLARAGLVTWSGPMLAYDFGAESVSDFTLTAFRNALRQARVEVTWTTAPAAAIVLQGTLWGGNLATVCSLLGTPYMPALSGGLLYLEDVAEPWFRIERMLLQLELAGVLGSQQAILLGRFSGQRADAYAPDWGLQAVVAGLRERIGVPIVTGLPLGHCRDKATLPVGAPGRLQVDAAGQARLAFAGHAATQAGKRAARC